MNSFLPIGSVFKQKKKRAVPLMVIGYFPIDSNTEELYDYLAVIYPQGLISPTSVLLINQEEIGEILFEGYSDDESRELTRRFGEIASQDIEDERG